MVKFFDFSPKSKTISVSEEFENRVRIRVQNKFLLGTVYADIEENEWAVAVAYNQMQNPGLHGRENLREVRYRFQPGSGPAVSRLVTDEPDIQEYEAQSFDSPDAFIVWALNQEKSLVMNPN